MHWVAGVTNFLTGGLKLYFLTPFQTAKFVKMWSGVNKMYILPRPGTKKIKLCLNLLLN